MRTKTNFKFHSFYCINCGEKIMDLPRTTSHQYQKHHRKVLYCPWCQVTCNAVECRNDSEVFEFKEAFAEGEYKEEAKASQEYISKMELI